MNTTYIHYGHKTFDSNLFTTPTNRRHSNKPKGGLWASAVDAPYGWKDWCRAESYRSCDGEDSFCFQINDNANVFTINSVADVNQMPLQKDGWGTHTIRAIDFELMLQNGMDVIEYNLSNGRSDNTMDDLYFALYGWDCDCILVLNPKSNYSIQYNKMIRRNERWRKELKMLLTSHGNMGKLMVVTTRCGSLTRWFEFYLETSMRNG